MSEQWLGLLFKWVFDEHGEVRLAWFVHYNVISEQ